MLLLGAWDVHLYDPQILLGLLREEIPYLCPRMSLRMQRKFGSLRTQRQTQEEMNIKVIKKVILVLMVLVVVTLPERGTAHDRRYGSWSRAGEPAGVAVFP